MYCETNERICDGKTNPFQFNPLSNTIKSNSSCCRRCHSNNENRMNKSQTKQSHRADAVAVVVQKNRGKLLSTLQRLKNIYIQILQNMKCRFIVSVYYIYLYTCAINIIHTRILFHSFSLSLSLTLLIVADVSVFLFISPFILLFLHQLTVIAFF